MVAVVVFEFSGSVLPALRRALCEIYRNLSGTIHYKI
ncbi:acetyltransferase [Vibrio cholerae]|nr:acetyltransferase [Vibrio cholerae]